MQVDPIKPTFKAPGSKRLKQEYNESHSNFAFKFNLRHYNTGAQVRLTAVPVDQAVVGAPGHNNTGRGLHSSTFPLNLSALYGIGGSRRGRVARGKGVLWGVKGV